MADRREESSPPQRRTLHIAPRADSRPPARDHSSGNSSGGRPPRLSHRSRAGCWTCRGRKVKCDVRDNIHSRRDTADSSFRSKEIHPRCGPCTRLSRDCDWDHRWNFSDATSSTQSKYANVTTTGNFVWDPDAHPTSSPSPIAQRYDALPAFQTLTNDEDRERKAETQRPGTFSVVATPDSFADMPEYAGASSGQRGSPQSGTASIGSPSSMHSQSSRQNDPTTVVLSHFEETSPPSAASYSIPSPLGGSGFPEALQQLSISRSPITASLPVHTARSPTAGDSDEKLVSHFQRYVFPRLVQPLIQPSEPGPARNTFEAEASRFNPLHHAMCAVSALNLSYNGRASLEEALQHYQHALSVAATPTSSDDLLSDGVFLRHFLLFIYDICIPMEAEHGGDMMWAQHLKHLRSIAIQRHRRLGREPQGYILWTICELDLYACLLGSGNCEFARTIMQNNMIPALEDQIPAASTTTAGPHAHNEAQVLPLIQRLNEGVLVHATQVAELAQRCRAEFTVQRPASPGTRARWHAAVSQQQMELLRFWNRSYPKFLGPDAPQAGYNLPSRARYVFEHAFALYQATVIYSRTSMYEGQRNIPVANQADVNADTERRCIAILTLASAHLGGDLPQRRHMVFPLFMAGVTTTQPDAKVQAMNLIKAMERGGIGQNTYRTRQLLTAVYEEQQTAHNFGGRVDWLVLAKERGLSVVNCGL